MKAWLMDAYRKGNKIVLWIKTNEEDIRLERNFNTEICMDVRGEKFLKENNIAYRKTRKQTYLRKYKEILEIPIPNLSKFETFIRDIEYATKHRIPLFNADIIPEQMYLYRHDLRPCSPIIYENNIVAPFPNDEDIPLRSMFLSVEGKEEITKIRADKEIFEGKEILERFSAYFKQKDPDVIIMDYAFSKMPLLKERLDFYKINCPINRWDDYKIKYRGGRSFWSYGQVRYRDYAVRLKGRFLVDTNSFVGTECEPEGIVELAQLSGTLFQQTASRSFGAAFQTALIREMVRRNYLVPFKEKPIERPFTMLEMLKADRAGHTFDPKVGFHKDVCEIDFTSMFPWLIYNHNISADCMLADKGPFVKIPKIPLKTSMAYKGLIPTALKPFIDRRMHYKKNPTKVNKKRAFGLKWVLVSCYGYLRFREFKLGIPGSHMAICSYARETLLKVIHLAEEKGYEVVHAIVDSVFIKRKNIQKEEVDEFCKEVELLTGIPVAYDGIFKWVNFLPSVLDKERALPSTYYGVFRHGDVKCRGIEVRQRSVPEIVKLFQKQCIGYIKDCNSKKEITERIPYLCRHLREVIKAIPAVDKKLLTVNIRVSKTNYTNNIPQKIIVEKLKKKGVKIEPGQFIRYIFQRNKVVLPEEYNGKPDIERYKKLLVRSLFVIMQPFGLSKETIEEYAGIERQAKLSEFLTKIIYKYIPLKKEYDYRKGLSERLVKERLVKEGWEVWRGGLMNILKRDENYPNVWKKYTKLMQLLKKHNKDVELLQYICTQSGMPDYLCYRHGKFKFVECKLQYEQLSRVQKKCIERLTDDGFDVEVHKIVDYRTKTREASVYVLNGMKEIREEQMKIAVFKE